MTRQLTDGVWIIRLPQVNAYLVADDVLTLVDAGMPWDGPAIREAIEAAGFDPETVQRVLVTHFDIDHVGGLQAFPAVEEIYVGQADAPFVTGAETPEFTDRKRGFQRVTEVVREPPPAPVRPVADGDVIGSFTAVHTPGHTPGHTVYVSEERDVAFVGDLVTSDGASLSVPPWYLNQDTDQVRASIAALAEDLPPVDVIAPGHGEPLVSGAHRAIHALAEDAWDSGGNS
jgi:glyoxylase-like metal-dependent hydrolase (beta-lactamase superfamily II)